MAKTTPDKTKAAAARPRAAAKESTTPKQKGAVARTADLSEEVLKAVESGQRAAMQAVRKFVDTVDEALPAIGDRPSRRETLIDAALDMADKLLTTQYDFLRSIVRSADRSLSKPGATKKYATARRGIATPGKTHVHRLQRGQRQSEHPDDRIFMMGMARWRRARVVERRVTITACWAPGPRAGTTSRLSRTRPPA